MSNVATPTVVAKPGDLTPEPGLTFPRPARLPRIEPDLSELLDQFGEFNETETANVVNRAAWYVQCGASPAGAVEDAVSDLRDGMFACGGSW